MKAIFHLFTICLLAPWSEGKLLKRSLSGYPLAKCNDGTPANYYYTPDLLNADKLVINLQGGGACYDKQGCQNRCKNGNHLCTESVGEEKELTKTMWSSDPEENPPFHDAAKVWVHYCSSDLYTGTRDASEDTGNFFFHGRYIVQAVVEDIIKHAPNLANLNQLVLMGESAGAYGVGFNCDMVADRFHEVMPGLDVRCVADAGDFYPPYMSTSQNCDVLTLMSNVATFYQSEGDTSCFSGTWGPDNTELECLTFMTSYPHITTPFFVVNHYVDTTVHGWCTPPLNENPEFWAEWEEEVEAMALRYVHENPGNGFFLSNCRIHVSSGPEWAWGNMPVAMLDNPTEEKVYRDVLASWLNGGEGQVALDQPLVTNPSCRA